MREIDAPVREDANYARLFRGGERITVQLAGGRARHGGDLRKHIASWARQTAESE